MYATDFIEPRCNFVRTFAPSANLDVVRCELVDAGIFCAEIDGKRVHSDESLFMTIAESLRFPDYFGRNWDALLDCLRDLDWLATIGCVVVVHDAATAFRRAPRTMGRFVETCGDVAAFWLEHDRPFHLVLLMPQDEP